MLLNTMYKGMLPMAGDWAEGDICEGLSHKSGMWGRAKVGMVVELEIRVEWGMRVKGGGVVKHLYSA